MAEVHSLPTHAMQRQSAEQACIALGVIADAASTIERLSVLLTVQMGDDEADHRDTQAFIDAVAALAQRVGLIADRTGLALAGHPNADRQPEDWMMPPSWHNIAGKLAPTTEEQA